MYKHTQLINYASYSTYVLQSTLVHGRQEPQACHTFGPGRSLHKEQMIINKQ